MDIKVIGLFGKRNVGKSSICNFLLGQDFSIISNVAGTTTDPVKKRMEIFGVGAVQIVDTAGVDDIGEVGKLRVAKSTKIASEVDLALLVCTNNHFGKEERELLSLFKKLETPLLIIHNKSDITPLDPSFSADLNAIYKCNVLEFNCNARDKERESQKEMLLTFIEMLLKDSSPNRGIMDGLVKKGDHFILVTPIDDQAPTNRLILPQVMAIREILDNQAIATVLQPSQLKEYIEKIEPQEIKLVVTDSQAFKEVDAILNNKIPYTSFSILLARSKGLYEILLSGAKEIKNLKANDKVIIMESCTHHATCNDIGRVKIPRLLNNFVGGELKYEFVQGLDTIPPLDGVKLVLQCGGCMVTKKQLTNRIKEVALNGVAITNYGMAIAILSNCNPVIDF